MSFPMKELPSYDESRLGTATSFQDQASISGLSSHSGLSSLTLVDSTAQLQKPISFQDISLDEPESPPKARSKLRLFSILSALYVCFHPSLLSEVYDLIVDFSFLYSLPHSIRVSSLQQFQL